MNGWLLQFCIWHCCRIQLLREFSVWNSAYCNTIIMHRVTKVMYMYALNVHSCCRLVIDVHILVSPNDGCPCMWSGVVRQSNVDSALREVPYNSLRRTTDHHGRPPPRLITRAQLVASLAFPWLKTCTTADEYYACIFLMTSRTGKSYILARCRIYVPMLINRIVVPQGKHGNEARENA